MHQYPQSMPEGSETVSITRTPAASTCRRSGRAVRHNPWWKYPVTGDENETDQFGGTSAAYNRGALALAALRSTVGDAKFREIEKTWVQEHQEQFDPTGLKITATYSDKSTKAIDAAERRVQPAVQDRRQHGSDHRPGGTRTADGRCRRGETAFGA